MNKTEGIRCVIHGSFRKHFDLIQQVRSILTAAGIDVIAPAPLDPVTTKEGFVFLEGEEKTDQRLIELLYLQNLKKLGRNGFSYFVNPEGYIGKSTSYELGIAQLSNVRCFFSNTISDHPAYIHQNSIWKAESLAEYISENRTLPNPSIRRNEKTLHKLWTDLMVPGSVVATGAIIEHESLRHPKEKEILLVKTHKWGGKYSIVGGKVKRNELLKEALMREVEEETGLRSKVGRHICTFDQIKNSGYYLTSVNHIFVDNVVTVPSKKVRLNDEAEEYIWVTAKEALESLEIESNARHTLELYANSI